MKPNRTHKSIPLALTEKNNPSPIQDGTEVLNADGTWTIYVAVSRSFERAIKRAAKRVGCSLGEFIALACRTKVESVRLNPGGFPTQPAKPDEPMEEDLIDCIRGLSREDLLRQAARFGLWSKQMTAVAQIMLTKN